MVPSATNEQNYSLKEFEMHFYIDEDQRKSTYRLYNDDGKTPDAFEKGMYEFIEFEANQTEKKLNISVERKIGENIKVEDSIIIFKLHNVNTRISKVLVDNEEIPLERVVTNKMSGEIQFEVELSMKNRLIEIHF